MDTSTYGLCFEYTIAGLSGCKMINALWFRLLCEVCYCEIISNFRPVSMISSRLLE